MRAIRFKVPAGAERATRENPADITVVEEQLPTQGPGEVLIRVQAAGINAADLHQRDGNYPPPPGAPDIPGLEVYGTIEASEAGSPWQVGDAVCALLAGGGYAEYVAVDSRQVLSVPKGLSPVQVAGVVEVAATVWANLVMHAGMTAGDHVLIHGGTGGIGQFAIQLARALGAHPIATSGSAEKCAVARDLGAEAINYRSENFVERVFEITDGHGADVILDPVGGAYLNDNVRALASGGRLVIIGTQGGGRGELAVMPLLQKRAWVTGTTLRSRSAAEKQEVLAGVEQQVWPLIESGEIRVGQPETFRLSETVAAYNRFRDADRLGKIVLSVG